MVPCVAMQSMSGNRGHLAASGTAARFHRSPSSPPSTDIRGSGAAGDLHGSQGAKAKTLTEGSDSARSSVRRSLQWGEAEGAHQGGSDAFSFFPPAAPQLEHDDGGASGSATRPAARRHTAPEGLAAYSSPAAVTQDSTPRGTPASMVSTAATTPSATLSTTGAHSGGHATSPSDATGAGPGGPAHPTSQCGGEVRVYTYARRRTAQGSPGSDTDEEEASTVAEEPHVAQQAQQQYEPEDTADSSRPPFLSRLQHALGDVSTGEEVSTSVAMGPSSDLADGEISFGGAPPPAAVHPHADAEAEVQDESASPSTTGSALSASKLGSHLSQTLDLLHGTPTSSAAPPPGIRTSPAAGSRAAAAAAAAAQHLAARQGAAHVPPYVPHLREDNVLMGSPLLRKDPTSQFQQPAYALAVNSGVQAAQAKVSRLGQVGSGPGSAVPQQATAPGGQSSGYIAEPRLLMYEPSRYEGSPTSTGVTQEVSEDEQVPQGVEGQVESRVGGAAEEAGAQAAHVETTAGRVVHNTWMSPGYSSTPHGQPLSSDTSSFRSSDSPTSGWVSPATTPEHQQQENNQVLRQGDQQPLPQLAHVPPSMPAQALPPHTAPVTWRASEGSPLRRGPTAATPAEATSALPFSPSHSKPGGAVPQAPAATYSPAPLTQPAAGSTAGQPSTPAGTHLGTHGHAPTLASSHFSGDGDVSSSAWSPGAYSITSSGGSKLGQLKMRRQVQRQHKVTTHQDATGSPAAGSQQLAGHYAQQQQHKQGMPGYTEGSASVQGPGSPGPHSAGSAPRKPRSRRNSSAASSPSASAVKPISYLARRASRDTTFSPLTLDLRPSSSAGGAHRRTSNARSSTGGSAHVTDPGHQPHPAAAPLEPSPYLINLLGSEGGAAVLAAAHDVYQTYMGPSNQGITAHRSSTQGEAEQAPPAQHMQTQQQQLGARLPGHSPGELALGHGVTGAAFSPPIQVSLPPPQHELRVDSQGNVAIVPAAGPRASQEWAHSHSAWRVPPEYEAHSVSEAALLQAQSQGYSMEGAEAPLAASQGWSLAPAAHHLTSPHRKRTAGGYMLCCMASGSDVLRCVPLLLLLWPRRMQIMQVLHRLCIPPCMLTDDTPIVVAPPVLRPSSEDIRASRSLDDRPLPPPSTRDASLRKQQGQPGAAGVPAQSPNDQQRQSTQTGSSRLAALQRLKAQRVQRLVQAASAGAKDMRGGGGEPEADTHPQEDQEPDGGGGAAESVSLRRPRPSPSPHLARPAAASSPRVEQGSSHAGPAQSNVRSQARTARSHAAVDGHQPVIAGHAAEGVDSGASAAAGESPDQGSKPFLKRRSRTIAGTRVDWSHVKPRTVTRSGSNPCVLGDDTAAT
jgi:hypothetical protein